MTIKSQIVYVADGSVLSVRHAWAFDEMSSASGIREIETRLKGVITPQDLAPLAQVNMQALKEFDYFTSVRMNGTKQQFDGHADSWVALEGGLLTLHFTLPFKSPVKAQTVEIEIYDPSYFVDISLAKNDPITLVNAPTQCKLSFDRQTWAHAANKITVICP